MPDKESRPEREEDVSVVNELREEIQTGSDGDDRETEGSDTLPQLFAAMSDQDRALFALAELDEILAAGEGLELAGRKRMLSAADRALAYRRRASAPLQVFLEQIRAEQEMSVTDLANELSIDDKDMVRLERGETPLSSQEPNLVANWISKLHADLSSSLKALRRSLELGKASLSYSERQEDSALREDEIDTFISAVEAEVSRLEGCNG
jgi:hypothetical protein